MTPLQKIKWLVLRWRARRVYYALQEASDEGMMGRALSGHLGVTVTTWRGREYEREMRERLFSIIKRMRELDGTLEE